MPETGETDNATIGQAVLLGFQVASDDDPAKRGPNFPQLLGPGFGIARRAADSSCTGLRITDAFSRVVVRGSPDSA